MPSQISCYIVVCNVCETEPLARGRIPDIRVPAAGLELALLLIRSRLLPTHHLPLWSLWDTLPMRRLPETQSLSTLPPYSQDVAAGSSLNSTGRMSVGVAVKPPDECFRRLETAPPDSPSPSALPYRLRPSEEGA